MTLSTKLTSDVTRYFSLTFSAEKRSIRARLSSAARVGHFGSLRPAGHVSPGYRFLLTAQLPSTPANNPPSFLVSRRCCRHNQACRIIARPGKLSPQARRLGIINATVSFFDVSVCVPPLAEELPSEVCARRRKSYLGNSLRGSTPENKHYFSMSVLTRSTILFIMIA